MCAPADATQEEEQAAAESEAGETFQGGVGKEWTGEEEEELNLLIAGNLAEAGSLARRARLTCAAVVGLDHRLRGHP